MLEKIPPGWAERGGDPTLPPSASGIRIPPGSAEPYSPTRELFRWMNDQFQLYGDIFKASIFGVNAYVIRSPEYAQHVVRKNWQNYARGQAIKRIALLLGNGLIVSEGEFWKRQRRMVQPAFHRNAVAALMGVITAANIALLEKWQQAAREGQTVNVTRDVSRMVLEVVLRTIFGNDYQEIAEPFNILSEESARDLQFAQTFRLLRKLVGAIVARRRTIRRSDTDILGMLVEARDRKSGQGMSNAQIVNEVMTLVVAGHETTAITLNWSWYFLAKHPHVEQKMSAEINSVCANGTPGFEDLSKFTYTRYVLEEAMRLYPPLWLMTRKAVRDDRLGEYFVPAGTEIYVPMYFIQRNPALWDDPDHFDPDRFDPTREQMRHPLAQMPFGAGPRNCVGEPLARLEMQMHLMTIAKRLRLRYDERTPPQLEAGVNLRSKHDFIMTPEIKGSVNARSAATTAS
jgi:cytochrome P450